MSTKTCSRESQINVHANKSVMIVQPHEVGFQGKNIHVSAGEGMKQLR